MKNKLKLTIPIPPSINNDYLKPRGILTTFKGKTIATAMMYETKLAKDFKKEMVKKIKEEITKQNFIREYNKFVRINWTFFFPRIDMDSNNYYKSFLDSITETNGLIWNDDNISMNTDTRIYYDSKSPRVEIEIYYEDFIGIFDNQDDLDKFIDNNCSQCKKGSKVGQKGGCSIYKKALESRIQEDLEINFESGEKRCLNKK
jgi:hypothetical protein